MRAGFDAQVGEHRARVAVRECALQSYTEAQVLDRGEIALERGVVRQVSERSQVSRVRGARVHAVPVDLALLRLQQAAHHPQEARFSDTVGSGDVQGFTGPDLERDAPQDVSLTAPEMQVRGFQHGAKFR